MRIKKKDTTAEYLERKKKSGRLKIFVFLLRNVTNYSLKFYQEQTYGILITKLCWLIKNYVINWSITSLMYILGYKTVYCNSKYQLRNVTFLKIDQICLKPLLGNSPFYDDSEKYNI